MTQCTVEGCDKKAIGRGWCSKHYERWRKYGSPNTVLQVQKHGLSLRQRFLCYVPVAGGEGCWEWTGYRDENGYGRLSCDGVPVLAHRLSWVMHKGPLSETDFVLHRCDNPPCVKPGHLFLGTQQDNNADKMRKKRHRFGVSQGEKHGCSVLTEQQVLEIRASVGSSRIVGEKYGVSGRTVRQIRTRETWTHLP